MSRDLFVPGVRQESARTRKSSLVVASAIVHVGVVTALVVASMLLPGILPTPHASMVWDGARLVRLADIPLPPAAPKPRTPASSRTVTEAPVPLSAPDGIQPEPERPPAGEVDPPGVVHNVTDFGIDTAALAPPPPPPTRSDGPVRLHSGMEAPHKVRDTMPVYPALAKASGIRGVVIIEATIDARGDVVAAKVLRSVPMLDDAALDAVRQWKYTPARLNGEPVAVVITVTVNFTLAGR